MRGGMRRGPTILRTFEDNKGEEFRALNDSSGLTSEEDDDVEMEHIDIASKDIEKQQADPFAHNNDAAANPRPVSSNINDFIIVVHFRQLRGNQRFTLDHNTAERFAIKIGLTPQQRIQFNGVHDTDSLTAFLYKCKIDFAIKIHHKAELARIEHQAHADASHHQHHQEHDPEHETLEFSDNVFVEFKPKHHHHEPLEHAAVRRPFFRYPEPDLTADIGVEKAASWLELFYDLFYVATLTQFTHSHVIKDWTSLGTYTSWFVITWWAWISSSLYTARFDTDDVVHHIWKLVEMCAVIGMAGNSMYFLTSRGYVLGYIALKAVLAIEYGIVLVVAIRIRSPSKFSLFMYVAANLVSIALWAGSLMLLEQDIHRLLWYMGILVEILINVFVRDKRLSWAASHLAERLGLLTLIVLGENLMNLVSFVAVTTTEILMMVPNFIAVTIIFGFFFMYFEDFNKEVFLQNRFHQVWVYLHFPLHLLQVAFGISLIDTLKVYKQQMTDSGKLHEPNNVPNAEGAAAASSAGHAEATASGSDASASPPSETHPSATPSDSHSPGPSHANQAIALPTTHGGAASGVSRIPGVHHAQKLAVRAIADVQQMPDHDYNPMTMAQASVTLSPQPSVPLYEQGYLTMGVYALQSLALTAMHLLSQPDTPTLDSTSHHSLMKRSGGAEGESSILTDEEKVFVYKTFFMFGGGIMVVNSLIKLLNTKLSDMRGKVIIGSRVLVAVILWCMCAIPFASLDAIYLLAGMVGAVVVLALVDLLD
ncbi:LtrA-domain-containing protein [Hesseltinella vesiculosa]|uniref:LtrA-domain-containing protein n=1 Tax=Hesseltinella vesiculosa TaxID=101127 RepID=A0A1X2GMY8_9FUNG|nr:LtrA-domain-containing protein [Hesseltinella vesiculosa]